MIKKILPFILLVLSTASFAETIKTDVLVIGASASGTAAAIQSARSNVKTMLIEQGPWLGGSFTAGGGCILKGNLKFGSGIWAEFRKHIVAFYKKTPGYDTTAFAPLRYEPYTAAGILGKITDTVKNLTVKFNTNISAVKQDGTGWEVTVTIANEKTVIKAKALIDATVDNAVALMAGVKPAPLTGLQYIGFAAVIKDNGPAADRTIAKPEGYDPKVYSGLTASTVKQLLSAGKLPNDKYFINWPVNLLQVDAAMLQPDQKEATYRKARLRTLGLIYYLQTELGYKRMSLQEFNTADHLPYSPLVLPAKTIIVNNLITKEAITAPYQGKEYRTWISVMDARPDGLQQSTGTQQPNILSGIPLDVIIARDAENLIVTENQVSGDSSINRSALDPAVQMTIGQSAGASAAFLAFFKTVTKNIDARATQGEIINYKGYIFPITDIPSSNPYVGAVQQICATGLLRCELTNNGSRTEMLFKPDSTVNTAELKPVLNEIYTRAFLWFNQTKPAEKFTVGNLLSFISNVTLTSPDALKKMVQKDWESVYKFKQTFDTERPVTRYEFAVLANRYINPFARRVDRKGNIRN